MESAFALVQRTYARLLEPEAALPHASSRAAPASIGAFNSLVRTLNRIIALKTRLQYDQSTQTDSIAAERARRAALAAKRRRAGARMEVQRQVRIALETASRASHPRPSPTPPHRDAAVGAPRRINPARSS